MRDAKKYMGWVEWLYSHCGDDDEIGDFGLQMLKDSAVSLEMNQFNFQKHVHSRVSSGSLGRESLKVMEHAIIAYRSYKNRIEDAINEQTEKTWLSNGGFKYSKKQF